MKSNTQKGYIIPAVIAVVILLIIGGIYYFNKNANICWPYCPGMTDQDREQIKKSAFEAEKDLNEKANASVVTIMVPENLPAYEKAMTNYVTNGGQNPAITWKFVPQNVVVDTNNVVRTSAEEAAKLIKTQASSLPSQIAYLKVVNKTAYILLVMDIDGWAGVSRSITMIHPIVEKTLLNFPEITTVKFNPAPGDTIESIKKSYLLQKNKPDSRVSVSDWKTYQNILGFQIEYPSDWKVVMPAAGEMIVATNNTAAPIFTNSDSSQNLSFNIMMLGSDRIGSNYASARNIDEYLNLLPKTDSKGNVIRKFVKTVQVAGQQAYWYQIYGWNYLKQTNEWVSQIYLQQGNYIYEINNVDPSINAIPNQILSTLIFIDQ